MQMTFDSEDEQAYFARREELCTQFAKWAHRHSVDADAGDVELLLDWKWGYGDGRLDRWNATDVEEFLLEWCPRKLSAPPDLLKSIPDSVGAYVDFLAHEGMLARGCSPSAVRRTCADLGSRFLREMADPANFGMAKSLFGGVDDTDPNAMIERIARLAGTSTDEVLDYLNDPEPPVVGPVRVPTDDEVAAAIAQARMFAQVRGLATRCPPPGLALTASGNLRLADARRLSAELETGDEAEPPNRKLGSARELPYLSWLVDTAIAAGAVRRVRGRLVAVARFADRPDRDAYERTVRGALEAGLGSALSWGWGAPPEHGGDLADILLAELLDADAAGVALDALAERVAPVLSGSGPLAAILGGSEIEHQLARLADLGLVTLADDGTAALTAAGRAVGAEIVTEAGVEVVYRADPATADADALVASMLMLDEDDAIGDLQAWAANHSAGAAELTAAVTQADLAPVAVLTLLEMAGSAMGAEIDRAAELHRDGPHGTLVTMWLLLHGALDPSTVDPELMLVGTVEVAAALIDDAGPERIVEFFDSDVEQTVEVLGHLWRAEHERTIDVLDALGSHHPNKKVAKAARRSLMKARNRG